ncbi:MAG: TonB-dependent receptor, partial [Deltaproteobacteria bacterium]|nr:TonB-dependent receptor [Deltaproteobacteria bacterium]
MTLRTADRARARCSSRLANCRAPVVIVSGLVAIAIAALPASRTFAQQDADAGPPSVDAGAPPAEQPALTRPELIEFVRAEYPADLRARGVTGATVLRLTVGTSGTVTEASVATSSGHTALDEAAMAAARRFRFRPATRRGQPIAARIQYRYEFTLEPEAPAVPTTGRITGRIRATDGSPVVGASVRVSGGPGVALAATTDVAGRFAIDEALPPGVYRLAVTAEGFLEASYEERVEAGEATGVTYRLTPVTAPGTEGQEEEEEVFESVTTADRPAREVTRRTLDREFVQRVPGTSGDALRAIEALPGVARPPAGLGLLIVRGAAPRDSATFVDGVQVPLLYHFGGLRSFMNTSLLERIDFFPGNFSARFGRQIGGIIEIEPRDPRTDQLHGIADVNLIDASVLVEGPIGERGGFFVGARRSYVDFFLEAFIPEDIGQIVAAPVYWDYQTLGQYRITPRDRLRLFAFGSSDRFEFLFTDPNEMDPALRGDASLSTGFHRANLSWLHTLGGGSEIELMASLGYTTFDVSVARDLFFDLGIVSFLSRAEWRQRISSRARLIVGMDIFSGDTNVRFRGPPPQQTEGVILNDFGAQPTVQRETNLFAYRPGAYVEAELTPFRGVRLVPGLRIDYARDTERWAVDPRLAARWQIDGDWTLKGGLGLYSQPPQFGESDPEIGNPNLRHIQATHYGLGLERRIRDGFTLSAEGFFKWIRNLHVNAEAGDERRLVDEGVGRIYGLEIGARHRAGSLVPRLSGLLSYTLSRSERLDHPQEDWRLFDFDQTHIFSLVLGYDLGRGWDVGIRFRLVSGNPETPYAGAYYNARTNVYSPIPGAINSRRLPAFHQLDLRIAKRWRFTGWSLELYLDV